VKKTKRISQLPRTKVPFKPKKFNFLQIPIRNKTVMQQIKKKKNKKETKS